MIKKGKNNKNDNEKSKINLLTIFEIIISFLVIGNDSKKSLSEDFSFAFGLIIHTITATVKDTFMP